MAIKFDFETFGAPVNQAPVEPKKAGLLGGIQAAFSGRVEKASEEIVRAEEGEISPVRATLRTAGQAAGFVGDVAFEGIKALAPAPVEELAARGVQVLSETELVKSATERYSKFKEKHPEAAKDVEAIFNVGALIPGARVTAKLASRTVEKIAQKTGQVLEVRRSARIKKEAEDLESAVGRIVQGKPGDIPKAAQALRLVDTEGITTYKELGERIDDKVELLSTKLDDYLESQKGSLTVDKLKTVTEVGDEIVEQNFVTDAILQLKELYEKTKDATSLAKINQFEKRLNTHGLTRKELNDLAREYGVEFKNKAFSRIGEPLTSINAQAFENTRKGIKNVVRNLTEGDAPKLIDSQLSVLLRTRPLITKMEEKVNALYQKAQKRGLLERAARGLADVVNLATFNTLSGFISRLLPSNVGLKVLNSIDLERQLEKNLAKVEKLLAETSDAKVVEGLREIIKEGADQ